jgi:uncharacterized protein YjiS (DUF1127 family)
MTTLLLKSSSLLDFVSYKLAEAAAELQNKKAVKQTINELNALSDRELTDMGICRGDITAIANGIGREELSTFRR